MPTEVLQYLTDPTPENWERCAYVPTRVGTLWRAVRAVDPTFPRAKSVGPEPQAFGWTRLPPPGVVLRALRC